MKHWLIPLDLSLNDFSALKNILKLAEKVNPEHISLVNIYSSDIPTELAEELKELTEINTKERTSKMQERADFLTRVGYKVSTKLITGDPLTETLRELKNGKHDLLVASDHVFGHTIEVKLTRKAPCSVILIQHDAENSYDQLLLSMDLSDYSSLILEDCKSLIDKSSGVVLFNAIKEASNYLRHTKTYHTLDEVNHQMGKRALINERLSEYAELKMNEYKEEIGKNSTKLVTTIVDTEELISQKIIDNALQHKSDLVIIGSKGKSSSVASLLGTNSETLVQESSKLTILVIKEKGENKGFLNSLLGLTRAR